MKKGTTKKVGVGTVVVEATGKMPEQEQVTVSERITDAELCNVGVTLGTTINIGNYENVKVQVSLFVPCQAVEVEEVFDVVSDWVDDKMNKKVDEIRVEAGI